MAHGPASRAGGPGASRFRWGREGVFKEARCLLTSPTLLPSCWPTTCGGRTRLAATRRARQAMACGRERPLRARVRLLWARVRARKGMARRLKHSAQVWEGACRSTWLKRRACKAASGQGGSTCTMCVGVRRLAAHVAEVEPGLKVLRVLEHVGHEEVEQRPQLRQVVLQRRACGQGDSSGAAASLGACGRDGRRPRERCSSADRHAGRSAAGVVARGKGAARRGGARDRRADQRGVCVGFCICLDAAAGPEPNYRAYQMSRRTKASEPKAHARVRRRVAAQHPAEVCAHR